MSIQEETLMRTDFLRTGVEVLSEVGPWLVPLSHVYDSVDR